MRQHRGSSSTKTREPIAVGIPFTRSAENESLCELAISLASFVGSKFFRRLVDELCRMLSCDFALVGELLPGLPERVRTIAASRKGAEMPEFEYGLDFSPCTNVMGQTLRSYARGVQALFPKDAFLSQFGIEGYLGIPLFDSSSSAIGLLVVLYEDPVQDVPRAENVLQIFASRASVELEWLRKDRALRESERRYRTLFERNVAGVFKSTLEGEILEVNEAFVTMFGFSNSEELKTEPASKLYPCPEERTPFIERLKKERVLLGYECELRRRDGSTGWTVENVALVFDDELGKDVIQGTIIDVTALKRAEHALRESERQLRHAAKSAQLGYWHWDVVSDRASWSDEEFTIFGITRAEWTPTYAGYLEHVHPEDVDFVKRTVDGVFRGGGPTTYELRIVRPNGVVRHIRTTIESTRDDAGRTVEMFGTTLDLTEHVRAEEEARRRDVELAQLARVSTLGEMAAGLAHELNQPLSAIANYINGCTRRLRDGGTTNPAILNVLERASSEALRAGEIVRQLRDFIRRADPVRRPVSVNRIVEETVRLLGVESRYRGVVLSTNVEERLPLVSVDAIQIEQVLVNLIRNAIDAMQSSPPESRRIVIGTCRADGGHIGVSVRDTGPGITPELADRVFDSFVTTKPEGLGMGLSISRRIVQAHGGELWVESSEGGAILRFTLPIETTEELVGG